MDVRFDRDLLLEEELLEGKSIFVQEKIKAQKENLIWVRQEPLVTQDKIKVQEEEEPIMVQEETKEENEKEVESK